MGTLGTEQEGHAKVACGAIQVWPLVLYNEWCLFCLDAFMILRLINDRVHAYDCVHARI